MNKQIAQSFRNETTLLKIATIYKKETNLKLQIPQKIKNRIFHSETHVSDYSFIQRNL